MTAPITEVTTAAGPGSGSKKRRSSITLSAGIVMVGLVVLTALVFNRLNALDQPIDFLLVFHVAELVPDRAAVRLCHVV